MLIYIASPRNASGRDLWAMDFYVLTNYDFPKKADKITSNSFSKLICKYKHKTHYLVMRGSLVNQRVVLPIVHQSFVHDKTFKGL